MNFIQDHIEYGMETCSGHTSTIRKFIFFPFISLVQMFVLIRNIIDCQHSSSLIVLLVVQLLRVKFCCWECLEFDSGKMMGEEYY